MPVISRFHGIVVRMYLRQKEHNPPHIHAVCGDYIGLFHFADGEMFEGDMPEKIQRMMKDFIVYYRERLLSMWTNQQFEMLPPII